MVGWMTCDFTSFSTVFQSHEDDGWVITKESVQWNPFTVGKSTNNRPALNSLKVVETEKVGGLDNSLMCTRIL